LVDKTPDKYFDPVLSQLIGTVVLTHEYRQQHPIEENKKPKKKPNYLKRVKGPFSKRIFEFFGDETA